MNRTTLTIQARGRGLYNFTTEVNKFVQSSGVRAGLCNLFIQHTSASLMINENADPDVLTDLETFMSGLVVDGDSRFTHTAEGPDDMPSHIRSALTQTSLSIPISENRLALGTWQGLYLWEHRYDSHSRSIVITIVGM